MKKSAWKAQPEEERTMRFLKCALLLLAATTMSGNALAQGFGFYFERDPSLLIGNSLENEGSFGLLYNSYDYAAMNPADLAMLTGDESTRYLGRPSTKEGDPRVLYTNLANFGEVDTFQLGGFTGVGPGNLAAAIGYSSWEDSFEEPGFSGEESDSFDGLQAFISYGWKLSDATALGFTYNYADSSYEEKDTLFDDDTFVDEANSNIFAAAYRQDLGQNLSFNIKAYVSMTDSEYGSSDEDSFERYDIGRTGYGVKGRVNWYRGNTDVEFRAALGFEDGEFDEDVISRFDSEGIFIDRVTDDDLSSDYYMAGVRFLHRHGDTDFGAGFELQQNNYDFDVTIAEEVDGSVFNTFRENDELESFTWSIPLTVRHWFSPKFSVFAGARFQQVMDEYTFRFFEDGSFEGGSESRFEYTRTDYRLGFRYQASDFLAVQALFGEDDADDDDDYFPYPRGEASKLNEVGIGSSLSRERIDGSIFALSVSLSF